MDRGPRNRATRGMGMIGMLLAAALALAVAGAPMPGQEMATPSDRPGARLVAEYRIPASTLSDYAAFAPRTPVDAASSRRELLNADAVPWTGPSLEAGPGRNPFNLVLEVSGVTRSAGDMRSLWQAGWEYDEGGIASFRQLVPLAGIARAGVDAGTRLTLSAASGPVTFRSARKVTPFVGMVNLSNFEVEEVRVQVWSGTPPLSFESIFKRPALALACVLGWLAWAAARRLRNRREWREQAATSESCATTSTLEHSAAADGTAPAPEAPEAAHPAPLGPAATPQGATPSRPPRHDAQILATLRTVLTEGLTVAPQSDEARLSWRRGKAT
jgi:hypothetical protein